MPMRIAGAIAVLAVLCASGCGAVLDKAVATSAADAFAGICFAPDADTARTAARRHYFRPLDAEAARRLLGETKAELFGRRAFSTDLLYLSADPWDCTMSVGASPAAVVEAQYSVVLQRLARDGFTVALLYAGGTPDRPTRSARVTSRAGQVWIASLVSGPSPANSGEALLQATNRGDLVRLSYQLRP